MICKTDFKAGEIFVQINNFHLNEINKCFIQIIRTKRGLKVHGQREVFSGLQCSKQK